MERLALGKQFHGKGKPLRREHQLNIFGDLLDPSGFVPRWQCGRWDGGLGWILIFSDLAITAAYFAIPAALAALWIRRRDVPYPTVLWLFVAFIVSCGLTHLVDAWLFYVPMYRLSGLIKAITAVVSLTTAVVLIRSLPGLVKLQTLGKQHEELQALNARERELMSALEEARGAVEKRNADLSVKWKQLFDSMASARAVAVRWHAETNRITWHAGLKESSNRVGLNRTQLDSWLDLLDSASAQRLQKLATHCVRTGEPFGMEPTVNGRPDLRLRISATAETPTEEESGYLTGMFRFVRASDSAEFAPLR